MKPYQHKEYVQRLMKFNGFEYAESLMKKNSNEDPITGAIGLIVNNQTKSVKNQILQLNDDTFVNSPFRNYLRIAQRLGFKVVLEHPFQGFNTKDLVKEWLYVLWNNELGVLLKFDTMNMETVKSAFFYFNWKPKSNKHFKKIIVSNSHCTKDWVLFGDYDCREALHLKIELLEDNGNFIVPWIKKPIISLCHYADKKGNMDKITNERLDMINDDVLKECIGTK